jgi:Bpu10I restriction endonuclease
MSPEEVFGRELDLDSRYCHGSNILKKATDPDILRDSSKVDLIREIAGRYVSWRERASSIPFDPNASPDSFVEAQTQLYQEYRDLLDEPRVDVFDSRGALQPSALEEFCVFLFAPLVALHEGDISLGHREVFQGLFFTSPRFSEFAKLPDPTYPVGNIDFVISKRLSSRISSEVSEKSAEIFVPAVAVECKTYLDRPRWIECDILGSSVKRGFPQCLFIVISEFLKLKTSKVNIIGSSMDHVYVFRRKMNVDRKIRRAGGTVLVPLYPPAVLDFYARVARHLTQDWKTVGDWQNTGILK